MVIWIFAYSSKPGLSRQCRPRSGVTQFVIYHSSICSKKDLLKLKDKSPGGGGGVGGHVATTLIRRSFIVV